MKGKLRFKHKRGKPTSWLWMFASIFCVASFFGVILTCYDMPSIGNLESSTRHSSVTFEAYDGTVIATYGDLFHNMVQLNDLPKYVYESIIAIEDRRFWHHCGIDVFGILRALYNNFSKNKVTQGGSTLTQQLAKNIFLVPNRSIKRKIQELVLSLMIEHKFTKKQILTIYLNRVYFGSGAYGIDAAAFRLFGKRAKYLKLHEAAKLAACLKSPTNYSPIHNPDKSDERTISVLNSMYDCGYITKQDLNECLSTVENGYFVSNIMSDNRYFTDWLLERLHNVCSVNEDLIIRTTLDTRMQNNAIVCVRKALLNTGLKNNANQIALISIDNTGAVRAMVGGHTYGQSQFNRCTATRSPGSAFKFFVYLTALEMGKKPTDMISDEPITIGNWTPKNYHWQSRQEISLTDAFAFSVNTAAVRLAKQVGIANIAHLARRLGYNHAIPEDMTMVLGSGGTNLLEMVSCYSCIMADGQKIAPYGIISIRTKSGKIIYKARRVIEKNALDIETCRNMRTLMAAVVNYGTGKRSKIEAISYGKTGTSNNSTDAWYIGFSGNLATGIWVGNDDNTPMNRKITGGTLPAETWRAYVSSVLNGKDLSEEVDTLKITSKTTKRRSCKLRNFVNQL